MQYRPLEAIAGELKRAAIETHRWPDVLAALSDTVEASGALLFCIDRRSSIPIASPNMAEMRDEYLRVGWHEHDIRFLGVPAMERQGVVTDLDCVTPDHMRTSAFYQDFLGKHGLTSFAGVGFRAAGDLWCLSIQRSKAQGPFQRAELEALKTLWRPFADAATMSRHLDDARLLGMSDALEKVGHAALICDRRGRIAQVNTRAEALIGSMIDPKSRMLVFRDAASTTTFATTLAAALRSDLVAATEPIAGRVSSRSGRPLLFRALPLGGPGSLLVYGDAVLILIRPVTPTAESRLADIFGLTPMEVKITNALAMGLSVEDIAIAHGVKPDTVRKQIKSVFSKTETHRQGALITFYRALQLQLTQHID